MKTKQIIIFLLFLMVLLGCKSQLKNTSNTGEFVNENDSINLFAFIGEKISVIEFDPNADIEKRQAITKGIDEETGDSVNIVQQHYIMDSGFRCKYKIVKNIFNHLPNDTIEFIAYDHYGKPGFAEKDTVILYLSKNKIENYYFHQKYQYDNVFKDEKGNYFSYPKFPGTHYSKYKDSINGFKINLKNEKYILQDYLSKETIKAYYPKEFYKIKGKTAFPIKGIYLNELFNFRLKSMFKDLQK